MIFRRLREAEQNIRGLKDDIRRYRDDYYELSRLYYLLTQELGYTVLNREPGPYLEKKSPS